MIRYILKNAKYILQFQWTTQQSNSDISNDNDSKTNKQTNKQTNILSN